MSLDEPSRLAGERRLPYWPPPGFRGDEPVDNHAMLLDLVRHLDFRMPGWRVRWSTAGSDGSDLGRPGDWGMSRLDLVCTTVDTYTYSPGDERVGHKRVQIAHRTLVPQWLRVEALPRWFREQVHRALQHEADEWLRVQDWMAWNPHGEPKHVPPVVPAWGYEINTY